jgi:hypothetical protein
LATIQQATNGSASEIRLDTTILGYRVYSQQAAAMILGLFPVRALVRSLGVGCANSHCHKVWMRFYPGKGPLFRIKETIDYDRVALRHTAPAQAGRLAIDNIRSAVYSQTLRIMKDNFAAIGNFLWIDGTMFLGEAELPETKNRLQRGD